MMVIMVLLAVDGELYVCIMMVVFLQITMLGITFAVVLHFDLNSGGQLDLLFGSYDDRVHVWDPVANDLLEGWPVDLGFNILRSLCS